MGLFGGFFSAVKSTIKSAGRAIGSGIEKVGQAIGSDRIERFGSNIKEMCTEVEEVARRTGETESYDKESARLYETQRINEALSQFSLNLQQQADELEEDALEESRVYFEYLIDQLRDASEKNNMKININKIKRELLKIEKSIKGSFKSYLAKRISLDDSECLKILKMDAGSQKELAMKKLGNKVLKEAREQLCDSIKACLIDQQEYIDDQIMDKIDEMILNLKDLSIRVNEFESLKHNNEEQIEMEKAKCISKLQIIDTVLEILE